MSAGVFIRATGRSKAEKEADEASGEDEEGDLALCSFIRRAWRATTTNATPSVELWTSGNM
jgi:hypothetical protein